MFEQFNQDLKALLNKEEEAKKNLDKTRGEINELKDKFCKHITASFQRVHRKESSCHRSLLFPVLQRAG